MTALALLSLLASPRTIPLRSSCAALCARALRRRWQTCSKPSPQRSGEARVLELSRYLTEALQRDGHVLLSPGGPHRSGQTLVRLDAPPRAVAYLEERGILVTEKPEGIRVSTHFYNDERDVDRLVAALRAYGRGG